MGSSFKCKICDRPMPPRVYEFHLKKSHTEEEVQTQVEKNEKELSEILEEKPIAIPKVVQEKLDEIKEPKKIFDWGEVYPCNTCGEEYPAKAMPFHSWVKHRV